MFLEFYGLREQPFGVTPDPRFLYLSPMHREALASLYYGIEAGRGFLSMIARPGMGKTTLLFQLLEEFRNAAKTAFLFQTQCDSREFIRFLLAELGIQSKEQDRVKMHEEFNAVLLREMKAGKRFVVVIDEAQNLDDSVLETVRLLSNFETPRTKLMQIILSGQPELADKLSRSNLAQLRQRISIVARLEPLSAACIHDYIQHRLQVAGYKGSQLFLPDAEAAIIARSEGIPRTINNLCFNAMSLGYALGRHQIDASLVEEITGDLDLENIMSHPRAPQFTIPFNSPIFAPTAKWGQPPTEPASPAPPLFGELHNGAAAQAAPAPGTRVEEPGLAFELEEMIPMESSPAVVAAQATASEDAPSSAAETASTTADQWKHAAPVFTPIQNLPPQQPVVRPSARVTAVQGKGFEVVSRRPTKSEDTARRWAKPLIFAVLAVDVVLGALFVVNHQGQSPRSSSVSPAAASVFSTPVGSDDDRPLVSEENESATHQVPFRVTVPSSVMEDNLVHKVPPAVPTNSNAENQNVVMQATVGRDGTVRAVHVLDGDATFAKAAKDAVMQWRYKPYLVNGRPTDVDTEITVTFDSAAQKDGSK